MNSQFDELFTQDISDEAAYQLSDFLYSLALIFESHNLGKIMRYQRSLEKERTSQEEPWKNRDIEDWSDPPF